MISKDKSLLQNIFHQLSYEILTEVPPTDPNLLKPLDRKSFLYRHLWTVYL